MNTEDYLPCRFTGTYSSQPAKPFPHLVMSGKTIAEKLKIWHAANGGVLTGLDAIDVKVLVLTYWQVESPVSTRTRFDSSTIGNEPWPLEDPWPDEGPTRDYEVYFHDEFGCEASYSKGTKNAHCAIRPRAPWHCAIGGEPNGTSLTHKTIAGDSSNGDCSSMDSSHLYSLARRGADNDWTESDYCLGTRTTWGTVDLDYTTHQGFRHNLGSTAIGLHGFHPRKAANVTQQSFDIALASPWDSLDNGSNCFQFYHWIDGIMEGVTHNMANDLHLNQPDGDSYYWYWRPYSSGPWRYKETTSEGKTQAYVEAEHESPAPTYRNPHIKRMEEYLNDYFELPDWTFDIDMTWASAGVGSFSTTPLHTPCYTTLTDYTVAKVCIR